MPERVDFPLSVAFYEEAVRARKRLKFYNRALVVLGVMLAILAELLVMGLLR